MKWLARSADATKGNQIQTYARHVLGVRTLCDNFLNTISALLPPEFMDGLRTILHSAIEFHDLGKLDDDNQVVLRGESNLKALPVVHSDAGVVYLLKSERIIAALLVASHHIGLLNLIKEQNRNEDFFRVEDVNRRMKGSLSLLLDRHNESLESEVYNLSDLPDEIVPQRVPVYCRMALSFLVDSDYTDSSNPNKPLLEFSSQRNKLLQPEKRLACLDDYIAQFNKSTFTQRNKLRKKTYEVCRNTNYESKIVACDCPVGSGKTTAIMAHLLSIAAKRKYRRIFVVLPFTNIIQQSVDVYRKSIILPGENPYEVVAEVHHLVDFEDESSRDYAVRWDAPIVVTTAVAFFETLSAANPSSLRRMHQLIGSAVFVDEAHAALPAKFLPVTWNWIQTLSQDWNVYWVLASGSLVKFWEIPEIQSLSNTEKSIDVPILGEGIIRKELSNYEQGRIHYETIESPISINELLEHVVSKPGPRLVILNTVQNAAVVANNFAKSGRFSNVFHLSTSLIPVDREITLSKVKDMMKDISATNWVLVGTSCIEAGIDLDFVTGFREISSFTSLIQSSGRVNRSGFRNNSSMISFSLVVENGINKNKGLEDSIFVLKKILSSRCPISHDLSTDALRQELLLNPSSDSFLSKITNAESRMEFPEVEHLYKIISNDSQIVVVNQKIISQIEKFEFVDWRDIQRNSVQINGYNMVKFRIDEIDNHPGLYKWNLEYSPFLGYMEGVLKMSNFEKDGGGVI